MITFQMHSRAHNIDYQFKFDNGGRIVGFEIMGENTFTGEHTSNLFSKVPETVGLLKQFALKNKIELTEIKPDLSFDTFWKKYNNTNGSRKKTEPIWNRLSEKNKNLAINYIDRYRQSLGNTAQAYASTYLNGEYWIK
ncbi:MAG: hypothetical protein K8R85_05800 [Bacteroidetes bacterium]|nr:hypothetical protein [Bacteroidota bacterium]